MAELSGGIFDASTEQTLGDFDPVPAGIYKVIITDSQNKPTRSGSMLALTMEIVEGQYQGKKVFENLNLENASEVAVKIARQTLSSICHVTGKMNLSDSVELHDIPFCVKLGIEVDKTGQYNDKNKVKEWLKVDGSKVSGPKSSASAAPAPSQDKPLEDDIPF